MQSIKDNIIQRIYKSKLSKIAIVLLLDILNLADENGNLSLYYKDYINNFKNGSCSQFYNSLSALEKAEFIIVSSKNNEKYIHINNVFVEKEDYINYVNTNTIWFTNREYANLKAGEIRTYLYSFFKIRKKGDTKVLYRNHPIYHYIAKNIGVTLRVAKDYCNKLNKLNYISQKNNDKEKERNKWNILTLKSDWLKEPIVSQTTEKGKRSNVKAHKLYFSDIHFVKKMCRCFNIKYNDNELNDTTQLVNQYRKNSIVKNKFGDVRKMFATAFKNISEELNPVSFHSIIKKLISMDYQNSISSYIKI